MSKFTLEVLMLMGIFGVYHGQGVILSRYKTSLQSHTVQGGLVFYTGRTPNFYMCYSLCGRYAGCGGVQYRPGQPGMCVLLSGPDIHPTLGLRPGHVCQPHSCLAEEVCVPTESATAYICLETGDNPQNSGERYQHGDSQTVEAIQHQANFSRPGVNRQSQGTTRTHGINKKHNQSFSERNIQQKNNVSIVKQQTTESTTGGQKQWMKYKRDNSTSASQHLQNISKPTVKDNIYKPARTTTHQISNISTEQTTGQQLKQPPSVDNSNSSKAIINQEQLSSAAITQKVQIKSAKEEIDQRQAAQPNDQQLPGNNRQQNVNNNLQPISTENINKHRQSQAKHHRINQSSTVVKHGTVTPSDKHLSHIPVKLPVRQHRGKSNNDTAQLRTASPLQVNTTVTAPWINNTVRGPPVDNTVKASPSDNTVKASPSDNTVKASQDHTTVKASPVDDSVHASRGHKSVTTLLFNIATAAPVHNTIQTPLAGNQHLYNSASSDVDHLGTDTQTEDFFTMFFAKGRRKKSSTTASPPRSTSTKHIYLSGVTIKTISSEFRKPCRRSEDCSRSLLQCLNKQCVCAVGYLWSSLSVSCHKGCTKYGDHIIPYPDNGISKHNNVFLDRVSHEECITKCLNATFTCLSFDYHEAERYCYLSNVSWFDVDQKKRTWNDKPWTLFLRQCI